MISFILYKALNRTIKPLHPFIPNDHFILLPIDSVILGLMFFLRLAVGRYSI
jgi:hypothetical protein